MCVFGVTRVQISTRRPIILKASLFYSALLRIVFYWRCDPTRTRSSSLMRLLDHTQRRTTVGRTPLDERSARRRDLYLTTHNTHNRQTSMLPMGFEPTISAGERPQTYALDRAATGTGTMKLGCQNNTLEQVTITSTCFNALINHSPPLPTYAI